MQHGGATRCLDLAAAAAASGAVVDRAALAAVGLDHLRSPG